MKSATTLLFLFFSCYVMFTWNRKEHDTIVYTSNTLKGLSFHLHEDKFKFLYQMDDTTDSTAGSVKRLNDTLFFIYKRKASAPKSEGHRKIGGFVSVATVFSPKQFLMHPTKLLIRDTKLLYLDPMSNQPLKYQSGDSTIQVFLERMQ